jgi:hypothetical protein
MADEKDTAQLEAEKAAAEKAAAVARGDEVQKAEAAKSEEDEATKKAAEEAAATAKGDKLDGEEDETPEEKAEREKAEEEARKKANIRIPKSRFDEAQAKARAKQAALEAEIEKLKQGIQSVSVSKTVSELKKSVRDLQDKYEDLLLDGKKDDARKVRIQLDDAREALWEHQTEVKSSAASAAAISELTYNAQLANLESKYPALNPDHDDFDSEVTNEIAFLAESMTKTGLKRADALAKAVKYVLGEPPAAKGSKGKDAAAELAAQRAEEARKKAAEADKRQPPGTKGVGVDSDKAGGKGEGGIDVMRLSQEKFAKLDAETLAKLRGDEVT